MVSPRGDLSVRSAEDGNVIAVYGPVVIFHLARRVNERETACLGDVISEGLRSNAPWGFLMVFARSELTGGIDPKAREIFERMVRQNEQVLERSALVVTADGFPGSVIRSIVAGLLQITGKRSQLKVFDNVAEGCHAVAHAHHMPALDLQRAYDQALAAIG